MTLGPCVYPILAGVTLKLCLEGVSGRDCHLSARHLPSDDALGGKEYRQGTYWGVDHVILHVYLVAPGRFFARGRWWPADFGALSLLETIHIDEGVSSCPLEAITDTGSKF